MTLDVDASEARARRALAPSLGLSGAFDLV